jgi:DNA recombination protein RmuC
VIVVSPTTLLAYLETVLLGYKAFRVEETAKEIVKNVENLSRHLSAFGEYHDKMGKTINTVVKQWNDSSKEFGKIDKDIMKITGETVGIEVLSLDKANTEENG